MEISPEHAINVIKDRTGQFQEGVIQDTGEEFGKPLGLNPNQIGEALKSANLVFDPGLWEDMNKAVVGYANGKVKAVVG